MVRSLADRTFQLRGVRAGRGAGVHARGLRAAAGLVFAYEGEERRERQRLDLTRGTCRRRLRVALEESAARLAEHLGPPRRERSRERVGRAGFPAQGP